MRASLLVLSLSLAACGDDEPADPCGSACTVREICNADTRECECRPERTGASCETCAAGYRPGLGDSCEPIVVDCDIDPGVCGRHGTCVTTRTDGVATHACVCDEGYGGNVCTECAPTHQDNDRDGTCLPTCATAGLGCDAPHVCTDHEGTAVCGCPAGMAGDACTLCARGWVDRDGTCEPTCASGVISCSAPRVCVDGATGSSCACPLGYEGELCDACADGWVDPLGNGECRPTCAVIASRCESHGTCVERDGFAFCECDLGWGGTRCDACARGYQGETCSDCASWFRATGEGACEPTCASEMLSCPVRSSCSEASGAPSCECEAGYTGVGCADCATSFLADGATCMPQAPAGHVLVSGAVIAGRESLVAIRPSDGAIFVMRTMDVGHLAVDVATDTIYSAEWPEGAPERVELATGTLTAFASGSVSTVVGQTFDTTRDVVYAIGSSADLHRFPIDGSASSPVATGLPTSSRQAAIAYDSVRDRILVASSSGMVVAVDPTTGAQTAVGTIALTGLGATLASIAHVTSGDALYALLAPGADATSSTIVEVDPETLAVRRMFTVPMALRTPNPWADSVTTLAPWSPP